ncbi:ABC transporter permease [Leptolyngbya sp. AN02str]|uniref:ABC transporter permease n=1 Tax=Leptolyngbya sp. AN02str TaxID=3423363 RepID=UPI003D320B15
MTALDKKLMRDLLHLWGQVLAIALIIASGIAVFVAMQTAYESLNLSRSTYYEQYQFADVFGSLKRAPNSLVPSIQALPGVAQVQTRVLADVTLDVPGQQEPVTGRLLSIPEQPPNLNGIFIRQGRYIDPARSDEVLVSEAFAKANRLQLGDTVGAVINGRWQPFRVVGFALSPEYVYEIRPGDLLPDNQRFGVLWVGQTALQAAYNMDGAFNDVALTLLPGASRPEVIFQLDRILEPYGGFGAYSRDDQISNRFLSDEITQLRAHAQIIPTIFLGIGAFLLHVLLSRLINAQRDQIAVLKAFGYHNTTIGVHFLKLVLAIVWLGAVIGVATGLWLGSALTQVYARFYQFPVLHYEVSVAMLLGAVVISSGAAIAGAVFAVRRAVVLPPAEAMRPEAPPRFQPTLLERLGLQTLLSPVSRIILRNLERKPIQALLSILGIALAVAMLVSGGYSMDATQHIIHMQFHTIQRDDVTVVFHEPRSNRARYEIAQLPGVMVAEPFRSVAARLRFGHRTYKIAIMGLDPMGELRHLVDRHFRPVQLPLDGLLLTDKLAELLQVQPGDGLTVEVLEGARPMYTVPVAGLVEELVGVSAYMDLHALNRLMQEDGTISGAFLTVDGEVLDGLYTQLKQMPAIASVSLHQAMIDRFQQTIAENQSVATSIQVVFACIIAFGVVYNAARIALSERGRELATLRIIGFSKVQVAIVLLGEQAALTIAAIPLGFGLGYGIAVLLSMAFNTELYRFPLIITRSSYAFAFVVIAIAALVSGMMVRRQCDRLDLIAVLKTRE